MNFARLLVMCEAIRDKRAQFFLQLATFYESRTQSHERNRNLPRRSTRTTDHTTLLHRRMLKQNRLYFGGSDSESFVLDHFLAAVDDTVKAFAIPRHDVSGPVPPVAEYRRGGGRLVPVAEHELRAAHDQFSRQSGWSLRHVAGRIRGIDLRLS